MAAAMYGPPFNSLFEMRSSAVAVIVARYGSTFNSLFEMLEVERGDGRLEYIFQFSI